MIPTKNYLEKLESYQLSDLAKFITHENFKHHLKGNVLMDDFSNEIESIRSEELSYFKNSEIFVMKDDDNNIVGAIRVLKWNYVDTLPLQKIFRINPLSAMETTSINNIYHIGRFAIKKEASGSSLFKKLMICAIAPVCRHKYNVAFAECDSKLLRVLKLMGIKATVIGKPVNYLGSETIPIVMTYQGLIAFFNKNKSLAFSENLLHEV